MDLRSDFSGSSLFVKDISKTFLQATNANDYPVSMVAG